MNNNINTIIKVGKSYNITQEQLNELTAKYQNDTREQTIIEKELTSICDFYKFQNNMNNNIQNTPSLTDGKNYYVTAFDQNSNMYLHPVSINVTNAETSEVVVDNSFTGYQKHTNVDDLEIAICQLGNALGFDVTEEYRVYNKDKQKDSIVIKNLVNQDEFYDVENLNKRFNKLILAGKLKKESWVEESENLKVTNTKEDNKIVIEYGLRILKSLPSMLEDDYDKIEEKYFEMLIFDCIINQSERNFKDYGILCDKETKRYTFSPLFDNVFPSILKNNDVMILNGITCNRYELAECLFFNYYDKVQKKVEYILNNKEKILNIASRIFKHNLDFNTYNTTMNNIVTNINNFERLINEKKLIEQRNNAGYVNAIQLVIALGILVAFSVCIAYLLYCIK